MPSFKSSKRQMRGVTLIELVVVVTIVAILAAFALPSFSRVLASNRIAAGVNEFIAATNLARLEAIRRGRETGVCASASGVSCGGAWDDGYMVYYMNTSVPATEVPIRNGKLNKRNTMTGGSTRIRFDRRGRPGAGVALDYKPQEVSMESLRRCLRVTVAGAVSSSEGACQ